MAIETLYENEWLSLKKVVAPEQGISGYVFSHESRCKGVIIAILPYRQVGEDHEFLLKEEVTPCWGLEPALSAITGGWEGESFLEDARRELEEETGYSVPLDAFVSLGRSFASKSSDTVYSLFTVDLTGKKPGVAKGDGSALEASAKSVWLDEHALAVVQDPQVHVMFHRLVVRLLATAPTP